MKETKKFVRYKDGVILYKILRYKISKIDFVNYKIFDKWFESFYTTEL